MCADAYADACSSSHGRQWLHEQPQPAVADDRCSSTRIHWRLGAICSCQVQQGRNNMHADVLDGVTAACMTCCKQATALNSSRSMASSIQYMTSTLATAAAAAPLQSLLVLATACFRRQQCPTPLCRHTRLSRCTGYLALQQLAG